jgi:hypothetical protein
MQPHFFSIYSNIDRYHLDEKLSLDIIDSLKKVVKEIDYYAENGGLEKQKYNEFHYVEYLNYIPLETITDIILNQFKTYIKNIPFSNLSLYIKEYYNTFIYECEELLQFIEKGKLTWWDTQENFDFYTYSPSIYEYKIIVWQGQTTKDLHFYELYLKSVIQLLNHDIIECHNNAQIENVILQNTSQQSSLKWNGTQTEFIELVKALIENGNIKGTQTEIIRILSNVFNLEIKNPNKLINDLKLRNNNSETLFLGRLQKTLFDYITLEKKK